MATDNNKPDPFLQLGARPKPEPEPVQDPFLELGARPLSSTNIKSDIESDPFLQLGATPVPLAKQLLKEKGEGEVTDKEVERIGLQYQLSPEEIKELKGLKEYYGSIPDDPENLTDLDLEKVAKATAGVFSRGALLNLPQFIYKKTRDNPNFRKALDDLQEVGTGRQSLLIKGTELGAGLAGAMGLSKGAAKLGGKASKVYEPAAAVTGGAVQAGASAREDSELKEAATGAALGGALFGGVYGAGKLAKELYKGGKYLAGESIEKAVKELEDSRPKIEEYIEKAVEKERPKLDTAKKLLIDNKGKLDDIKLSTEDIDQLAEPSLISRFKKDDELMDAVAEGLGKGRTELTDSELKLAVARDTVSRIRNITEKFSGKGQTLPEIIKESPEFASDTIERAYKLSKVNNAVTDLKIRRQLSEFNPLQKAALFISDGKQVAKIFDDKLGLRGDLSIEKTLDEGSIRLNRYTDMIKEPLTNIRKLAKKVRKAKVNPEQLYRELDTGNLESEASKEFRQLFDSLREKAKKADVFIEERENYVPKLRKTFADYRIAFNNQAQKLSDEIGKPLVELTENEYKQLKKGNKLFKELDNELSQLSGEQINSASDFSYFINKFGTKPTEMRSSLDTVAGATKQRTGEIPDWALEKNVPTLAARWVQSTFRHRAVRDTVQQLKAAADVADKAGDRYIARYLRNLTSDVLGKRRGTLNAYGRDLSDKLKMAVKRKAETARNPILKKLYEGTSELPSILLRLQAGVYEAYLGYNPKSALQNITSFYLQNMPELGPVLGTKLAIESLADLAALKAKGVNLTEMVTKEGIIPRQWTGEMVEALREGIKSGPIRDTARKALDINTNIAMALFTKSETLARTTTLLMAKRLGNYLAKNPKKVDRILANLSSDTYRKSISSALREGDLPMVQSELNKYMQSTNMFNYDRLNMSEYGRYMGPLFSIFSKWPTATAGKLAHYFINKSPKEGAARFLKVLLLPMAGAMMADKLLLEDQSDISKRILGSKGIKGWTQLDSLPTDTGIREGLLSTPILSAGADLADAVMGNRSGGDAVKKWINNSFRSFFPGAGTIRFLAEDIPLYKTGRKQEKFEPIK